MNSPGGGAATSTVAEALNKHLDEKYRRAGYRRLHWKRKKDGLYLALELGTTMGNHDVMQIPEGNMAWNG